MLDRPVSGRVLFEEVIRENLDLGRPDKVGLIFDRRIRPRGRHPTLSRLQYHKDGRALRTETTINDSRDFAIGQRLDNLPALAAVGFAANRRLPDVERRSTDPTIGDRPGGPWPTR
jgi:hypothetical protein